MSKYNWLIVGAIFLGACKKTTSLNTAPLTSFNVINVIPSTSNLGLFPVFGQLDSPYYYASLSALGYNNSTLYSPISGSVSMYVVNGLDTQVNQLKNKLFSGNFNLKTGGIYSLFLGGDTTSVDTLLTQDIIPYYPYSGDSVAGIRIINMSPEAIGNQAYNITLTGNPYTQPEFSNVSFKGVSSWKSYPASSSNLNGGYNFTIWNQRGDSLGTFFWPYEVYRSNTIVISGSASNGATFPLSTFQMNNYDN